MNQGAAMRWTALVAGAVAALWAAVGVAQEFTTAGQQGNAPRFELHDGKIVGLCPDLLAAITAADPSLTFKMNPELLPSARLYKELGDGTNDVVCGLIRTKEREALAEFIEPPLYAVNYTLAARADDDVKIASWDDVRALGPAGVVLALNGVPSSAQLKAMTGLTVDDGGRTQEQNLKKLLEGRGRFFYRHDLGLMAEINANPDFRGKVKLLPVVLIREPQYLLLSKKSAQIAAAPKLAAALAKLQADGALERIHAKYMQ
jgi:glutamate/aspartate transport system substrate-binding protein